MEENAMVTASKLRSFRQLTAWEKAMDLVVDVYRVSRLLPPHERFELARELRRSSISVPSNIAEGFNRHSQAAYRSHVAIALGSTGELETQIGIGRRLEYFDSAEADRLLRATVASGDCFRGYGARWSNPSRCYSGVPSAEGPVPRAQSRTWIFFHPSTQSSAPPSCTRKDRC
jgi:four helix bundle protein